MALVRNHRSLLAAWILAGACSACDTLHPPAIYNGVADPIEVRAVWSDGAESAGSIAPHEVSHLGRTDARLERITVTRAGETLVDLDESEIAALREKAESGIVGMSIDDDGPHDLSREKLDRIHATK